MTLHIALDIIDDTGKIKVIEKLKEFLTKKSYKTKTLNPSQNESALYILNEYNLSVSEKAQVMAINRSLCLHNESFEEYDVVLWDKSVLSDYIYYTNKNIKPSFIRNINKFSHRMDLHIIICNNKLSDELHKFIKKHYNVHFIDYSVGEYDRVLENIVKMIFDELPKCRWCGRLFTKSAKNKKYCSDNCRHHAKEEQNRDNFRNYYKRYKEVLSESKKGALGSKGANLHGSANLDSKVELKLINKEKKRLGL